MGFRDLVIKGFEVRLDGETQDPTERFAGWIIVKATKGDFKYIFKITREELASYTQDELFIWEQFVACEVLKHYNDKHLNIIVHRSSSVDAQKVFERFIESLFNESSTMQINDRGKYIDIGNIRIDFRCGDFLKLGGVRPNYFNTDSDLASCFLQQSANKVNGKEIKDISEIINIIKEAIDANSRSDKI